MMRRAPGLVFVLAASLTGCDAGPRIDASEGASPRPVQSAAWPEITVPRIAKDVVGRVVEVPEITGAGPRDKWTFEAAEYRHVEIVEQRAEGKRLDLLVFMLTRSVPKPGEPQVQVSGRLRLYYERKGGDWSLRRIENVSFRYSVGVAT